MHDIRRRQPGSVMLDREPIDHLSLLTDHAHHVIVG